MGFFPNIFKGSPTHILSNAVFPGITTGIKTIQFAAPIVKSLVSQVHGFAPAQVSRVPIEQRGPLTQYGGPADQFTSPLPAYPYYGGGGYAPSYPQAQTFEGGSPWDYSTRSTTYSPAPWATYSAAPSAAERPPWEDLALTALPFLL